MSHSRTSSIFLRRMIQFLSTIHSDAGLYTNPTAGSPCGVRRLPVELDGEWHSGIDSLLPDVGVDVVTRVGGTIATFQDERWTRLPDRAVIGSLGRAILLR